MEQEEEALGRAPKCFVVAELWKIKFYALAGGDVEEATAVGRGEFLLEHDPLPRMAASVKAVHPRVCRVAPPRVAHGAEADIAGHVAGEDALGNKTRRPIGEVCPVPPPSLA